MTFFRNANFVRSVRNWRALGLLLALAFVVGCVQRPPEPVTKARQTLDDLFAAVARQVPEFGGMFLGADEQILQIYLTDVSATKQEQTQKAIVAVFGRETIPQGGIRALQGQYGFLQLKEWYDRMVGPILSIPGVTFTDINEAKHRLGIGLEKPEAKARVLEQIARLNVPHEAVAIAVTGPIEPASHTVQDAWTPKEGGYGFIRPLGNQLFTGWTGGVLGFNALRGTVPGFVTNSHNTEVFWNLDTNAGFPPADSYQYFPFQPAVVGTETVDPQPFSCPSPYPPGYVCRYSDSAFFQYQTGVAWDPGSIGKTTAITSIPYPPSSSTWNIVLTVDHSSKFTVVAPPSIPYLTGLQLDKVGQKTGWTKGSILDTCIDVPDNLNRVRLCQYSVADPAHATLVIQGDSGSPVFRILDYQCGYAELYGILWGRFLEYINQPPSPWAGAFLFSPIGSVSFQQTGVQSPEDLGPLNYDVTSPGPCGQAGTVIIQKNTIGGDGAFNYMGTFGLFPITTTSGTGNLIFSNIAPGTYTVTELGPPSPWVFTSLVCSDPDNQTTVSGQTANIDLDPGETVTCTFTNTSCVQPPSGMVAWWPLDEQLGSNSVTDIWGYPPNFGAPKPGAVGSMGNPLSVLGVVGGALGFNGATALVEVPSAATLNFGTSDFSIDAWIRIPPPGTGFFMPIVDKRVPGPTDAPYGYTFYVKNGFLGFSMNNDINDPVHAFIGADYTTTNLADNVWHHVAVTVQRNPATATGGKLFINGAVVATFNTAPTSLNADNPGNLIIGSMNRFRLPVSGFFNGHMDEIQIFKRVITDDEVRSVFEADKAGKCRDRGVICGVVFHDINGDGVQQLSELGLPGWTIQVTDANGNVIGTATTGPYGRYCIVIVVPAPGTYTLSEVLLPGWTQTFPAPSGTHTVTVSPGQLLVSVNFGNN